MDIEKDKTKSNILPQMITVGIPSTGMIPYDSFMSFLNLQGASKLPKLMVGIAGSQVHKARNQIVEKMQGEWLMFIDSDMVFQGDVIDKLIAHNKDIVSALAFMKRPPFDPCIFDKLSDGQYLSKRNFPENQLIEVDAVGMACTLIKKKVLKKLKAPHFENIKVGKSLLGEDVSFCQKAKEAGFKVYCDTSVLVGHLETMPIGIGQFRQFAQMRDAQSQTQIRPATPDEIAKLSKK